MLVGNGWVIEEKTWHKGESYEKTDRWKTGDINWPGDYIDDKSCGTGEYALPEKEVEENDSGEGTKTRYEHRRSVCLCEDAQMDSYDEDDLLATSPGLPLGSKALPCDDMLVYSEEKYDKTTTAEAFAIVFIVLIVVGGCIACSVFAFMSQRRQRMLYEENEKKRQAQLANAAPIVHAPPVVQPQVQQGYVQPQAGYAPQGAVVQPGYGQPQVVQGGYAPQGQVVGAYPPAPPAGQVYAPQPGYAPQGTVVQGGYQPENYNREGY